MGQISNILPLNPVAEVNQGKHHDCLCFTYECDNDVSAESRRGAEHDPEIRQQQFARATASGGDAVRVL